MRAWGWVSSGISGVKLRGPYTSPTDGRSSAIVCRTCQAQAGLWWRTGTTTSSGVTRASASSRTPPAVRLGATAGSAVVTVSGRSAVQLAAGVEHPLPACVAPGTVLDDDVEGVAGLGGVPWGGLEDGADQLPGGVVTPHPPVAARGAGRERTL